MNLRGYYVPFGYMGWVEEKRKYVMFATESEYREYMEE